MTAVLWALLILLMLTLINGLLSMAEIAIVSARKTRLQQRAEEGDTRARAALELSRAPDRLLSTIQIGITLVGIGAGVYSGAEVSGRLAELLDEFEPLQPYSSVLSVALVVIGVTYLTLVVGELVPKRIGLAYAEQVALVLSHPLRWAAATATPAVWLLSRSTQTVLWLLRIKPPAEAPVSEEEIRILLAQGTAAGIFEATEQDIVERVFNLGDRRVSSLMTPRTDVVWLDIDEPIGDAMRTMIAGGHSYYPVCRGTLDEVAGLASIKQQWARMVNKQPPDIRSTLIPPLFVPATMPAFKALETFKEAGRHIALVIDEYGSICGVVTLNDVLEAIVGDVPSGDQPEEPQVVRRDDGSWLLDGMLPIDEFKRLFEIGELPGEERGEFHTIGGFMMRELGRIPRTADHLEWNGLRLEVMDMDGHRVDKVLLITTPDETTPPPAIGASQPSATDASPSASPSAGPPAGADPPRGPAG